jgi:hypothetical protein
MNRWGLKITKRRRKVGKLTLRFIMAKTKKAGGGGRKCLKA